MHKKARLSGGFFCVRSTLHPDPPPPGDECGYLLPVASVGFAEVLLHEALLPAGKEGQHGQHEQPNGNEPEIVAPDGHQTGQGEDVRRIERMAYKCERTRGDQRFSHTVPQMCADEADVGCQQDRPQQKGQRNLRRRPEAQG